MGLFWKICSHSTDLEKSERGMLPSAVSVVEGVRQGLQRGWQLSYHPSASSIKSRKQSRTELALLPSLCSLFSYSAEMSTRTHYQILGFPHIPTEEVLLLRPQTPRKSSLLPVVLIHNEANDHRELLQMTGWDDVCEISGGTEKEPGLFSYPQILVKESRVQALRRCSTLAPSIQQSGLNGVESTGEI